MQGILHGNTHHVPLPEANACKLGANCPIDENAVNTVSISLPIPPSYPTLNVDMKVEIKADDQNDNYICFQVPVMLTKN